MKISTGGRLTACGGRHLIRHSNTDPASSKFDARLSCQTGICDQQVLRLQLVATWRALPRIVAPYLIWPFVCGSLQRASARQ